MEANRMHQEIAQLAYQLWIERGRPEGSPEIDWEQAEGLVRLRMTEITRKPLPQAGNEILATAPQATALPGTGRRTRASTSMGAARASRSTRGGRQGAPHADS